MNKRNTDRNNDFKVPEGYFGQLKDRLQESVSQIDRIPERDGFSVPDYYLETLQERILNRTVQSAPSSKKSIVRRLYPIASAAALVAVLLSAIFGIISRNNSDSAKAFADILSEDIEYYVQNGFLTVDIQDIEDLFDSSELDVLSFSSLDDSSVIEYLEENTDVGFYINMEDE
ncbi:hypothetical protein [Sinomicrobium sp.]